MLRVLLCFLLLYPLVAPGQAQAGEFSTRGLDELIETTRKELQVPGAAVVIVHADRVVYLRGFGVREQGKPEMVTTDTVFPIASCSKAFTATLLAMLVDEGKLSWDDKVNQWLPGFRLLDPLADREVTVRDLLCHRTGVPRHDLLWNGQIIGTDELIRRWCRAQPASSFRSTWDYSSVPFTAAGVIAAGLNGSDWATTVERRLFEPLGMSASSGTSRAGLSRSNRISPHYHGLDGSIKKIAWDEVDHCGGSGALTSTARDLGQWLRFQLSGGKLGDRRILAEAALKETHRPQMLVKLDTTFGPGFPEKVTRFPTYGLGWFVSDYRGQVCISHGGTISGARAQVMLLPEKQFGIFVLCNLRPSYFPETVCRMMLDRVLEAPAEDWIRYAKDTQKASDARVTDAAKKRAESRKKDTMPSLDLNEYTGAYQEYAYGVAGVTRLGDALQLRWGKMAFRLEHYHHDTFTAILTAPETLAALSDRFAFEVHFSLGSQGEVIGLTVFNQGFAKVGTKK